jgi:hypothetical protein
MKLTLPILPPPMGGSGLVVDMGWYTVDVFVVVLMPLIVVFLDFECVGFLLDETFGVGVLVMPTPESDEVVETTVERVDGR